MIILGLGTNIGNRLQNLRTVLKKLKQCEKISIIKTSPIYESDALLTENAHSSWNLPYLNLAVSCETSFSPEELYSQIKTIEQQMGRPKDYPIWSPRLIDIDILAWHSMVIKTAKLSIPHVGLHERPFALWPLEDVYPNWIFPNQELYGKTIQEIVAPWGSKFTGNAPLHTKQIAHRIDCSQIVGILNITPDSFSDGGIYNVVDKAIEQAKYLYASGAEIIDIGAESTRPGHTSPLSPLTEWKRLKPVLQEISKYWNSNNGPIISIDTRNAETAAKAIALSKIDWINDVTGFDNHDMLKLAAETPVKLLFMHSMSIPPTTNITLPKNSDPINELISWTEKKIEVFDKEGITQDRLIFDPGIGFGKTKEQNFTIIKRAEEFKKLSIPILIGHSRKSFLNMFTEQSPCDRDIETIALSSYLSYKNVDYLRVHNVDWHLRAFKTIAAIY